MILTGKAKEEFFNWLDNQGVNGIDISNWEFEKFHLLSNVSQNSLIIEWFDSVEIHVNAVRYSGEFWKGIAEHERTEIHLSRQEAITEAIKKANEIYNSKYQ